MTLLYFGKTRVRRIFRSSNALISIDEKRLAPEYQNAFSSQRKGEVRFWLLT